MAWMSTLAALVTPVLSSAAATNRQPPPSSVSVAAQIANDMRGANEGYPHGLPRDYAAAKGPSMSDGNTPRPGWRAATAWGAVYIASEGNAAINTRVNLRNVRFYLLQKSTGKWVLLQNTSVPDGGAYVEDFAGDANKPADVRHEPDGTISVTAGGGYNFHFYPSVRASIDPNQIGGIVTLFEARLIIGNPKLPDDRPIARYLACAGGDYWPRLTGGMPPGQTVEPAIAVGKFKYVRSNWRSFAMTTLSERQLANNPPPVDFTGILP